MGCPLVTIEDPLVHLAQRGAGINAQLLDKPLTHQPIGLERPCLPAAAVLGEHQLSRQAFVQWVRLRRHHELTEQVRVPPRLQRGVVAIQCDRNPFRFNGIAHVVDPRCVKRCERLAAPQPERAVEEGRGLGSIGGRSGLRCDIAEPVDVHRQCIGHQHVAAALADDPHVGAVQHLTQSRYVCREGVARPVRKVVRPDPIDQLVGRDRIVDVDQQRHEDTSLACVPDVEATPIKQSLDVAEQPEFRSHPVQRLPGRRATGVFARSSGRRAASATPRPDTAVRRR